MAQAGRCYEDNPADYASFIGLYKLSCRGFADNYFECEERCPFRPNESEGAIYSNRTYTIFGDSKCQYLIKESNASVTNHFIDKDSPDLLIYHSEDLFTASNT